MTISVKELFEGIQTIADEVCCDGGTSIAAHKVPSTVSVFVFGDDDNDAEYELVDVVPSLLPGCGCWDGIILKVKRTLPKKESSHDHQNRRRAGG